jgi:fructokinase
MSQLRKTVNQFIEMSDIIKLSRKELYFVTEKDDIETSLNSFKKFKNKLIIITLDKEGSGYFYNGKFKMVSGFKVDAVDSTGAGDAFVSAFLYKLQDSNITDINASFDYLEKYLEQWLVFCNAAGCLNTMKHGATSGMTTKNKILSFINEYNEKNN